MNTKDRNTSQWKFKAIAVMLPFLFLVLAEVLLRLCNYGYDTKLFIEDKTGKYYRLNTDISQKYFSIKENATHGNIELFLKEKKPGTFRCFVLGESSSVGFPYMHNGSFSRMLKYRLQLTYPDTPFEIINLSLTAVNSYTLYDFSKQLINYKPDAILMYVGHNEYYGALGVASSSKMGRSTKWVRAMMAFKDFKLGQWLFRIAAKIKGTDKKTTDYSLTLMEKMARDQSIPYNSPLYKEGIDQFDSNMTDMLDLFKQHQIPVYISTLVYNQKDLKPFISSLDRFNADKQYKSGNDHYAEKNYSSAKNHYILAKEFDELRFRAPERMNILIRQYAESMDNVHLVDAEQAFEQHSPHDIMDSTLLLEHVHPNLTGQRIISDAFFEVLKKSGIIPAVKDTTFSLSITPEDYPFTAYDTAFGQISIWMLKELWPFNEPIPDEDPNHVRTYEEQMAGGCAVKQINWFDSMRCLYDKYKQNQDLENALHIMEGLCLEFPFDDEYFLLAGKLSFKLNKKKKALFYLKKANEIAPSPEALSLLDFIHSNEKNIHH